MQNGAIMKMRRMQHVPTSSFFISAFIRLHKSSCGGSDKYITYCYL